MRVIIHFEVEDFDNSAQFIDRVYKDIDARFVDPKHFGLMHGDPNTPEFWHIVTRHYTFEQLVALQDVLDRYDGDKQQ